MKKKLRQRPITTLIIVSVIVALLGFGIVASFGALPTQLKAARLSDASLGSTIDDKLGELESALGDIFGFALNADITESPTSFDQNGRFTKALLRQKAAGPVGWRIIDSTSGKEFRLVVSGSNVLIDENTDFEATPVWVTRATLATSGSASLGNPVLSGAYNSSLGASTTRYFNPNGSTAISVEYEAQIPVRAGTLKNLRLRTSTAQSETGTQTLTVWVNGVASTLVATITAGGAAGSFVDTTHTVAIAAGDRISLELKNNAPAPGAKLNGWSMEFM